MSFAPAAPSVGDDVTLSVTSARSLENLRVTGPSPVEFLGLSQGGLGYVWRWRVVPTEPGSQTYSLWLGETTKCGSVSFNAPRPTPTATPTKTPTATGTPRPDH